jgi:DNA-binding CsgD family transcriptional regulator
MHTAVEVHPLRYLQDMLQLVERIYAAACGEIPWEQTFAEICRVGKVDGCALSMLVRRERRCVVAASYGLCFGAEAGGMPGPIPGDPRLRDSVLQSAPGAIWQDRQIVSDAPPTALSFWTDGIEPAGSIAWACAVVATDDREVVCLELHAGAGRTTSGPELDDLLRQLAPHLARAWRLRSTIGSSPAARADAPSGGDAQTGAAPAPELAGLPEVARLRVEFGLTKAEARLALRLAEGSSLASAAQAFNVKLTTIRSQLQQVFAKTGTCRQTELMALILSRGYGNRGPLANPVSRERQLAIAAPGSLVSRRRGGSAGTAAEPGR